jgi:hypothetical protein
MLQLYKEPDMDTPIDFRKEGTAELLAMAGMVSTLSRPEEIAFFEELVRRLTDYSQISANMIKGEEKKTLHEGHVDRLRSAVTFYQTMVHTLGTLNLIDFQKPVAEWVHGVSQNISELNSKIRRLRTTIGEIYCMHRACGDVIALSILPDDVQETVTASMKTRKLRLD